MSLLGRLLGRRTAQQPSLAVVLPLSEGPLYAIGDIHGHAEMYDQLEERILKDAQDRGEEGARIVALGDYVDRGPDSAGMLDRLCSPARARIERHCLKGNHEVMFERFLNAPDLRSPWLDMGGRETLASYGLYTDQMAAAPRHTAQMIDSMVPAEHRAFLANLPLAFSTQTHFMCHAGVDPSRPLDAQEERALLWIRDPFLNHDAPLSRIVVHGHTPVAAPDLQGWRINVDTGAYSGGPLSAVRLDAAAEPQILGTD